MKDIILSNATVTSIDVFADLIKESISISLGDDFNVSVRESAKEDNTHIVCLVLEEKSSNRVHTICLNQIFACYRDGDITIPRIVNDIMSVYKTSNLETRFDMDMITDFSACKDKIYYQAISAKRTELLDNVPHIIMLDDIALIFRILISNDNNAISSIMIDNSLSSIWAKSAKELFDIAKYNTPSFFRGSIEPMGSVLIDMLSNHAKEPLPKEICDIILSEDDACPLYICTNDQKHNGAGVMLYNGLLKDFAENINSNLFIIPASIHETLLVPMHIGIPISYLKDIVRDINKSCICSTDVLSDSIYFYSREDNTIRKL